MTLWGCDREDEIRRATAAGQWTPALEAHVTVCPSCRDVQLVTGALAAPIPPRTAPMNPALVFARARQAASIAAAARMSRILTFAQIGGAAAIVVILGAAYRWPVADDAPRLSDVTTLWALSGVAVTAATAWIVRRSTQ